MTVTLPLPKVYVAFEHEELQRSVLAKLSTGHIPAALERSDLDRKYWYEGENVRKLQLLARSGGVVHRDGSLDIVS